MDELIWNLLQWIWGSLWGKVILIILAVVIGLLIFGMQYAKYEVRRQLKSLQENWPQFSWQAIECRVRTVAELYFHGWNDKDLSALLPHLTPNAYNKLSQELSEAVSRGTHKPFTLIGFNKPGLCEIRIPSDERPPGVLVETEVPLSHFFSGWSFGTATMLYDLIYTKDGRWLVDSLRRDDSFSNVPDVDDPDTTWLETHTLPAPHPETVSPQRPEPIGKGIRGKGRLVGGSLSKAILYGLFLLAVVLIGGIYIKRTQLDARILSEGERIQAELLDASPNDKQGTYLVQYQFSPPAPYAGPELKYRSFMGFESPANVPLAEGEKAVAAKQIEIAYDPESPQWNLPVSSPLTIDRDFVVGFSLLTAVLSLVLVIEMVKLAKLMPRRHSLFWEGWKGS